MVTGFSELIYLNRRSNYLEKCYKSQKHFSFKTADGQEREETGHFNENAIWTVEGFFSYVDSSGEMIKMIYVADDQGYRIREDNTMDRKQEFQSQISRNAALSLLG